MRDQFRDKLLDDPAERAVWAELDGLRDSQAVRDTRRYLAVLSEGRERRPSWLGGWRPAFAATTLAAVAATALFVLQPVTTETLQTRVGEMRRESLPDGTVVLLNTDSRLKVAFGDDARVVTLIAGQARFDVAHDRSRPFRVTAGAMTVTAVGTAFDVVALPSRTAVTLIEGKVLVRTTGAAGAAASRPKLLTPGQQITIAAGRVTRPHAAPLESALAWQRSYVDLSNMTLDQALDEVNRYSTTKIAVHASGLGDARIGGVFKAGDVDAVTKALCAYFDLEVVRRERDLIVLGRS